MSEFFVSLVEGTDKESEYFNHNCDYCDKCDNRCNRCDNCYSCYGGGCPSNCM